jgi:hypothetical protein
MVRIQTVEREIMSFTPKIDSRPVVRGILTIAVAGLIGIAGQYVPKLTTHLGNEETYTIQKAYRAPTPLVYAVLSAQSEGIRSSTPEYYQPVSSWYKNKHWWKRNAPVVGGAAGGALIGGLAGGGTGALVGGAVGGGGGYAYKRLSHRHHHNNYYHHH